MQSKTHLMQDCVHYNSKVLKQNYNNSVSAPCEAWHEWILMNCCDCKHWRRTIPYSLKSRRPLSLLLLSFLRRTIIQCSNVQFLSQRWIKCVCIHTGTIYVMTCFLRPRWVCGETLKCWSETCSTDWTSVFYWLHAKHTELILSAGALRRSAGDSAPHACNLHPHLCRSQVPTRCPPVNIFISSVKTRCSPVTEDIQHKWKGKHLKFRRHSFDLPSNEAQHPTFSGTYFNGTIIPQNSRLQVSVGLGLCCSHWDVCFSTGAMC